VLIPSLSWWTAVRTTTVMMRSIDGAERCCGTHRMEMWARYLSLGKDIQAQCWPGKDFCFLGEGSSRFSRIWVNCQPNLPLMQRFPWVTE
jgi:hypothetical protein